MRPSFIVSNKLTLKEYVSFEKPCERTILVCAFLYKVNMYLHMPGSTQYLFTVCGISVSDPVR